MLFDYDSFLLRPSSLTVKSTDKSRNAHFFNVGFLNQLDVAICGFREFRQALCNYSSHSLKYRSQSNGMVRTFAKPLWEKADNSLFITQQQIRRALKVATL